MRAHLKGIAEDFSIEGRLENCGKPHYTREQLIENAYQCYVDDFSALGLEPTISKQFFVKLCDKVWGKELTSAEVDKIIEELLG